MGRYYGGDIEGKFWFGVQSSCDINNLVDIEYITEYVWKACGCNARIEDETFCTDCYENYTEHVLAIQENDYDMEEDDTMYREGCNVYYQIYKDEHYDELVENLQLVRRNLSADILAEFDKLEDNSNITSAYSGYFNPIYEKYQQQQKRKEEEEKEEKEKEKEKENINPHRVFRPDGEAEFIARYVIGLQIKYCLENLSSCTVSCEC